MVSNIGIKESVSGGGLGGGSSPYETQCWRSELFLLRVLVWGIALPLRQWTRFEEMESRLLAGCAGLAGTAPEQPAGQGCALPPAPRSGSRAAAVPSPGPPGHGAGGARCFFPFWPDKTGEAARWVLELTWKRNAHFVHKDRIVFRLGHCCFSPLPVTFDTWGKTAGLSILASLRNETGCWGIWTGLCGFKGQLFPLSLVEECRVCPHLRLVSCRKRAERGGRKESWDAAGGPHKWAWRRLCASLPLSCPAGFDFWGGLKQVSRIGVWRSSQWPLKQQVLRGQTEENLAHTPAVQVEWQGQPKRVICRGSLKGPGPHGDKCTPWWPRAPVCAVVPRTSFGTEWDLTMMVRGAPWTCRAALSVPQVQLQNCQSSDRRRGWAAPGNYLINFSFVSLPVKRTVGWWDGGVGEV